MDDDRAVVQQHPTAGAFALDVVGSFAQLLCRFLAGVGQGAQLGGGCGGAHDEVVRQGGHVGGVQHFNAHGTLGVQGFDDGRGEF